MTISVNSKRGEPNQMFQMLMTLIVIGMVMILGFQLISNLFSRSEQIDYINFRRRLIDELDTVASDYNARQKVEMSVPSGTQALCFVDMTREGSTEGFPLIDAYWNDQEYRGQDDKSMVRNAFLVGSNSFLSFTVDNLEIDRDDFYECIEPKRNSVEFWAESQSRSVTVEQVSD